MFPISRQLITVTKHIKFNRLLTFIETKITVIVFYKQHPEYQRLRSKNKLTQIKKDFIVFTRFSYM